MLLDKSVQLNKKKGNTKEGREEGEIKVRKLRTKTQSGDVWGD